MTEKNYITKAKNQFKSSAYYIFWGTATFAVVAGQLYVGSGYRKMSESLDAWFDKTISIMIQKRMIRQQDPYKEYSQMPVIQ